MKNLCLTALAILASFISHPLITPAKKSTRSELTHTEWVAKSLKEMQTIKVGMTRGDLLKVFSEEGGISTRTQRQYAYRECPYIKVRVEFKIIGDADLPIYNESSK